MNNKLDVNLNHQIVRNEVKKQHKYTIHANIHLLLVPIVWYQGKGLLIYASFPFHKYKMNSNYL